MTDVQIKKAATRLISEPGPALPPNHSLLDAFAAARAHKDLGMAFLKAYGDRLKEIDQVAYTALLAWRDTAI